MVLPPRAYLFIGLNVARFFSVLTLLLVFSSTIDVMVGDIHAIKRGATAAPDVKNVNINGTEYYYDCDYLENSTVPLQPGGSMFAIINHIFIIFQCILLLLSELSWPAWFFDDFIPVLGRDHGVCILGFLQIFIGAAVLSHHVSTFALVSAFFLFAVGCINVLLGLTFRAAIKQKRSLTSWRERVNTPALPRTAQDFRSAGATVVNAGGSIFTHMTGSTATTMTEKPAGLGEASHAGFGFGRQGEKQAGLKGFLISRPVESLPRYVPKPGTGRPSGSGTTSDAAGPSRSSSRASSRNSRDSTDSVDVATTGAAAKPNRI